MHIEENAINAQSEMRTVRHVRLIINNTKAWKKPTPIEYNLMNYTMMGFYIYIWASAIFHAWMRFIT